jgi:hypothetical protein
METMLVAEVVEIVDLPCREACLRFPVEAGACKLSSMARSWRGGKVRCIVLSGARPAADYINLSAGCLGFVSQFESTTGTPRFCHVSDLHKTMAVTLNSGLTVYRILKRSWPLTVNSDPCRLGHGDCGGGVGGGDGGCVVGGGGGGCAKLSVSNEPDSAVGASPYAQLSVSWEAENEPDPAVGASPYAVAEGVLMGFRTKAQLMKVLGKGDCLFLALCASIYFQMKDIDDEILMQHLTQPGDVCSPEFVNIKMMAGFGKDIVECKSAYAPKRKELMFASPFRQFLATRLMNNRLKFKNLLEMAWPDYASGAKTRGEKRRVDTKEGWSGYINTGGTYWVEPLVALLKDILPSVSVLLLCSYEAVSEGNQSGTLCFFDGKEREFMSSDREKGVRIVLHLINQELRNHLGIETKEPEHGYNLRTANNQSDNNHYEAVHLDVDPRFRFPGMDDESLKKLTLPSGQQGGTGDGWR